MWATQYTPNNDNVKTPGILSDGRPFTDYLLDSARNEKIKQENHITTNEGYRKFLVNNTDTLMKYNFDLLKIQQNPASIPSMVHGSPYLYENIEDETKPDGYEDSIPKQNFLSRQQIDDKKRRLYQEEY